MQISQSSCTRLTASTMSLATMSTPVTTLRRIWPS
jgi:hypothetical protein